MRIYEYLHTAEGGHVEYTAQLAHALRSLGAQVEIVTATDSSLAGKPHVRAVVKSPNTQHRVGIRWLVDRIRTYLAQPLGLRKFARCAKLGSGDTFHFQQLPTLFPTSTVRMFKRRQVTTVCTVHNLAPHSNGYLHRLVAQLQLRAARSSDIAIVHGDRLALQAMRDYAFRSGSVLSIPHPVWDVLPATRTDEVDYLMFGLLRSNKGINEFMQALVALGNPPATICGSGNEQTLSGLVQSKRSLGLTNLHIDARFVPDDEVPAIFSRHRVLVAPYTNFEAQSGVTHLAVAHGLPIVVTDVGGLADLVRDYGVGEIAPLPDLPIHMDRCLKRQAQGYYADALRAASQSLDPVHGAKALLDRLQERCGLRAERQ